MAEFEHDGVRRWCIYYRTASGVRAEFISDAVTMAGAHAHFEEHNPGVRSTHIRRIRPDQWLNRL